MNFPKKPVFICAMSFVLLLIFAFSAGQAEEQTYDGLWFLGFNMKNEIFSGPHGKLVRQAFNYAINRSYICREIIGDLNVPSGVIPLGLPGHNSGISGYSYSPDQAKKLLRSAGNKQIKNLVLIHTDGIKTIRTAQAIKNDLAAAGINISLRQIAYDEDDSWEKELATGTAPLFLMGYKVPPQPFEMNDSFSRSEKFLYDLFHSKGEANMFFLHSSELDALIETTTDTQSKEAQLKERLMEKTDRILFDNPVTVNLFYIKELQ